MIIKNKIMSAVVMALSVATTISAQPYLTQMGGEYLRVDNTTEVTDKDIIVVASHAKIDNSVKLCAMSNNELTISSMKLMGYSLINGVVTNDEMPAKIQIDIVNSEGKPYELVAEYKINEEGFILRKIDKQYFVSKDESNYPLSFISTSPTKEQIWTFKEKDGICGLKSGMNGGRFVYSMNGTNINRIGCFRTYESNNTTHITARVYRKIHTLSIGTEGLSTFYYGNNDVTLPAGVKAYTYTLNGNRLEASHTFDGDNGDVVPYGTAVIIQGQPNTEYVLGVKNAQTTNTYENVLRGSDNATTTTSTDGMDSKFYGLGNKNGQIGFYYGATNGGAFTNGAHKAYLCLPNSVVSQAKGLVFVLPDGTEMPTSIGSVETTEEKEEKAAFDLSGKKVADGFKGIKIQNGKAILAR